MKHVIHFNEKSHRYYWETKEGKKNYVPAVTAILNVISKPALIPWAVRTTVDYVGKHLDELRETLTIEQADKIFRAAKNESEKQRAEAADIGTQVHKTIEKFFRGTDVDLSEIKDVRVMKAYSAFLDWIQQNNFTCEFTEMVVYNDEDEYAGTLDAGGTMDEKSVILDWKTNANKIYPEAILQVAAYARAYSMGHKGKYIDRAYIVRFGKDNGEFEVKELTDIDLSNAYKVFDCARRIYLWQKESK